ncbi:hypothetical protein [Sandaracinus amylolyticus]|nr:hypothetical protein [Sandaracinus amylolyticus]
MSFVSAASALRSRLFVVAVAVGASVSACSSGPDSSDPDGGGGGTLGPAVVVVGQAYTPEDYLTYVRVFPEVPEGDIDFGEFREFGNANVSVHDGRIFVEQDGVVQRFSVSADLELIEGPRFSWADFGIPSANATSTVFISSTRAYTLAPQLGLIVVWNPDEMIRTGTIELDYPERPDSMETFAYDAHVIDGRVIWNMFSGDWATPTSHPGVVLAIANAEDDSPPRFVEDTRCLPGGPSFLDERGDLYVHGGGYFGYFHAYGGIEGSRTCALRVSAGEVELDPTYVLDYEATTGSYVNTPWIWVSGDQYVTRVWSSEVPLPASPDDFWTTDAREPVLVDLSDGTAVPYPDLEGYEDVDGATRVVDGVSYYQVSETGYVAGGNTAVVELHPDGTAEKFRLTGGFLLGIERVR